MNRRQLFKFLGIGAATAAVAPKVIAEAIKEPERPMMSGTPINMVPYVPQQWICAYPYPYYVSGNTVTITTSANVTGGYVYYYQAANGEWVQCQIDGTK